MTVHLDPTLVELEGTRTFPLRPPGTEVTAYEVPVDGGSVAARVIRPPGAGAALPCYVFFHGGGWMSGDVDKGEAECILLYALVPCVVVTVTYRLAPAHRFPVPLDDCVATYRWVVDRACDLGIDASRVAVGGISAGANLAAAVCLRLRDLGLPQPVLQVLEVPCLDLTLSSPSVAEKLEADLRPEVLRQCAADYAGGVPRDHPRLSPLWEPDLRGLAPALVLVGEHDPVRDDGERYVVRLHEAGVAAAGFRVLAHAHAGWVLPVSPAGRLVEDLRLAALRRAFEMAA